MKYCVECGTKLVLKELNHEGLIPYCNTCNEYRFPIFNSAISCIILNKTKDKVLLIKQYSKPYYVLVAGYINKGENAIETVRREVFEELGLNVNEIYFNDSKYFSPSNTCMFNFVCISDSEDFVLNHEVDEACWFSMEDSKNMIKENSLAQQFLFKYLRVD